MGSRWRIPRVNEPGAGVDAPLQVQARVGASVALVPLVGALVVMSGVLAGCSREAPRGGPLEVVLGFGESGNAPGQFGYPRAIDHDESGGVDTIWVIDKLARVQRLDAKSGRALEAWRMPKFDKGKPTGVTVWEGSASERTSERTSERASEQEGLRGQPLLFVADTHEHRVMVFAIRPVPSADETLTDLPPVVATFGSYGEGDGQMVYPTDVCVVPTADRTGIEKVFVSEYGGNDRVSIWVPDPSHSEGRYAHWKFIRFFGTFGDSPGKELVQFSRPQTMSLTDDGSQLIISDACNHRIGVFTLEGELVRWIATRGPGKEPGQVSYPYAIVPLGDGTIMVAEFGNNRLQRLDLATGDSLGIFGQAGRAKGQLSTPWSMTRVGDLLYVLDSGNSRVVALDVPRGRPEVLTGSLASSQISSHTGSHGGVSTPQGGPR
jgi:hypothetical protein